MLPSAYVCSWCSKRRNDLYVGKIILERQQMTEDPNTRTSRSIDAYFFFCFHDVSITLNEIFFQFVFFYGIAKLLLEKWAILHLTLLILETSKNIPRGWIVCSLADLLLTATYANRP